MSVIKAVYDRLKSVPAVTGSLGQYDFGSGNESAIFTVNPPPQDAPTPLIAINQTGGELTGRDRATRGGDVDIDVYVWGNRGESEKLIDEISMEVWRTLDRAVLTVDGYEAPRCLADPPAKAPDPEGYPGYLIRARVLIREVPTSS